jgi:NADPH2:quinone reductase
MKMMQKIFLLENQLGYEALKMVEVAVPKPKSHEVLLKHTAIGVNFHDLQYINGQLPLETRHFIPGMEAVGIIEAIGDEVTTYNIGQRVGYATAIGGGFAQYRTIEESMIFPVHEAISDEAAVINLTKGMTAHYLMRRTYFVRPEMQILIHGALSGVARLMVALATHYKAKIWGTVERNSQKDEAKACGYTDVFTYDEFASRLENDKFNVVYDGIGGDLIARSINSTQPFGLLVNFGAASGDFMMPQIEELKKKSLFLTFPSIYNYKQSNAELYLSALEVFALIHGGVFPATTNFKYKFEDIPMLVKNIGERKNSRPVAIIL